MAKRATEADKAAAAEAGEGGNVGMTEEEMESNANMAEDYENARLEQEKANEEAAAKAAEDAKTRPRVALGTAEAIALGVGNGDSPTEGERPEGWEMVAGDVRTTSALAGDLAEVDAGAEEALRKAEAERATMVAEAQTKAEEKRNESDK